MQHGAWVLMLVIHGVARVGAAQTSNRGLPPAPDQKPHHEAGVVAEQQDVRAGDVAWRPGLAKTRPIQPSNRQRASRWYGEPILIGDATAYGCILLAVAFDMTETTQVFVPPALLGYALVGPITHIAHGNWGRMSLSVLTRGLLPFFGLVLGASGCAGSGDCIESAFTVGGLGMGIATVLDASLIAREPIPRPRTQTWLAPKLEFAREGALLGVSGGF